jgi:MFS family permease
MPKKLIISTLFIFSLFQTLSANTLSHSTPESKQAQKFKKIDKKKLRATSQPKLNFFQKIAIKIISKKLAKKARKHQAIPVKKTDGLAIASFISAIAAWFVLGIILGLLAVIFGAIAIYRIDLYPETRKGKGFAIAGLILGAIAAIIVLFTLGFVLVG